MAQFQKHNKLLLRTGFPQSKALEQISSEQLMDFKEFKISDYKQAVELWSGIEGITLNESDSIEAIAQLLNRNPDLSYVASHEKEIIGTILCGHNGRAAQIYHLAVAREFRGQGVAKHLISLCFAQLAKENIPRCNIFVYSDNYLGNDFWLNAGWVDPTTWKVLQKHV